ncbi:5'-nucleotidase C-terminal domain-containing protein [Litoribacillus peritrichatus]|uniref:5'-Nucleotidase C-terminal domain-containing protein n=1 Tax=Litoribacillus peritrichatus TaxID=718191 RepID=A0ABP7N2S4_9GAMM
MSLNIRFEVCALSLAMAALLTGCSDSDSSSGSFDANAASSAGNFTLQLLHNADMDGATGALDNVESFSAIVGALRADYPNNTLLLSSGDNYIPGPRYFAASDNAMNFISGVGEAGNGRADIAFMNAIGYQASAVGNHDLDGGTAEFASIVAASGNYAGAKFPYLSANLNFSTDANLSDLVKADGQNAGDVPNALAKSTIIEVGGEKIGVVGATTPTLASITNTGDIDILPDSTTDHVALAASIQPAVNALVEEGVNKIILLSHMQVIEIEKDLAELLTDVDIIVAGGSNTLLADANDRLLVGDTAADNYPLSFDDADGNPTLVVNTDGDYKYLGRLVAEFDASGVLVMSSLDEAVNGVYASDETTVENLSGHINSEVTEIVTGLQLVLAERDGNILGNSSVYLDGRRGQVRTQETNLGNLTADANLWQAQQYDNTVQISIKNGGGIRDDIGLVSFPPGSTNADDLTFSPNPANAQVGKGTGDISQFDLEGSLRFNNSLTIMDITAQTLFDVLEHAVSGVENGAGRFAQVAGVRFSFDPARNPRMADGATVTQVGERVRSVAVLDADGNVVDAVVENGVLQGDPARTFRIVTLGFLASNNEGVGGDGYPWSFPLVNEIELEDVLDEDGLATFADPGSEQDALAEYLQANFAADTSFNVVETDLADDERIQNLSARADTVLP